MRCGCGWGSLLHYLTNRFEYSIQIRVNLFVGKAQEPDAKCFDVILPGVVIGILLEMAVSINLHREGKGRAIEVNDVWADAVLAAEFITQHLTFPKLGPNNAFRTGRRFS